MRTLRRSVSPYESAWDILSDLFARRACEVIGWVLLVASVGMIIALATWSALDPSLSHATAGPVGNYLGRPGAVVSDLLMQFFGVGAVALVIPLFWWGWRLALSNRLDKCLSRVLLWVFGCASASILAGSLPVTSHWPLPTGLGGLAGDYLLGLINSLIGATPGSRSLPVGAVSAVAAILAVTAACSTSAVGADDTEEETATAPAALRRGSGEEPSRWDEDTGSAANDEPGLGILSLGALIHLFMSLRSRLVRRRARRAEQRRSVRREPEFAQASAVEPPWANAHRSAATGPLYPSLQRRDAAATAKMPAPADVVERRNEVSYPADASDTYDDVNLAGEQPEQSTLSQAMKNASASLDLDPGFRKPPKQTSPAPVEPQRVNPLNPALPAAAAVKAAPVRPKSAEMPPQHRHDGVYEFPPLDLLALPKVSEVSTTSVDALEQNAALLESTLGDFGVHGEITNVRPGPVVTLYELEPAPGTKSSRVIGLSDDIARSMSAISARVAVVPGRNVIGIELPNARREIVLLRELLASKDFTENRKPLALCLGKNIGGEPVIVDLAKMPHLLIAGTTGSGKSVAINTMILSLLYRLTPEQCRLIMVDPKMLELSVYDGIPHLLTPVVTDPKKAVVALKWAVREMDDRYRKMSKIGVRNIDGFNERAREAEQAGAVITRSVQTGFNRETGEVLYEQEEMELEALPYIVVIVDEMADLMLTAGKDIEELIQRLAQKARAAGIHVILATQRPSVDVITGTIKANFPTRVSFQVSSKIDSRTILGEQGAEQLLGQGDMLYMAGGGRLTRVHGPFCSDEEVEKVVAHLKTQAPPDYLDDVTSDEEEGQDADGAVFDQGSFGSAEGDLYDQAVALVLRDKKASTSYVQRRLQIGYNRAATLIERMEREGIVSPANHSGKREILIEGAYEREGDDEE
ncbi:MAG: DNA translocase FtsK [Methylobacteriaceae bacterium]|nr:DNA translocase FtsK [Methylobacteriaceae bacterium]